MVSLLSDLKMRLSINNKGVKNAEDYLIFIFRRTNIDVTNVGTRTPMQFGPTLIERETRVPRDDEYEIP